ncbi:MAG TPA: NAD(P)-dependent oxidoreductase [Devosiaceae bacterium]|jgi:glyoxylate reductase
MTENWNVLVSRHLPESAVDTLKARFNVDWHSDYKNLSRDELLARARGKQALCLYSDNVDAALLDALPDVQVISCHWGARQVDLAAATERGVMVACPPNQYGWIIDGVAELVWGLMIAAGRRFREADAFSRAGKMDASEASTKFLLGEGMVGRTLGLWGGGRIGLAVGKRAQGFGMRIIYHDLNASEGLDALGAERVDLDTLLRQADYLSLSIPPVEANRRVMGPAEFAKMKPTAVFINTARGMSVDEEALIDALKTGKIFGAGLDVYEREPEIHPGLKALENVILMPHAGGSLREQRTWAATLMADNIIAAADGEIPPNLINPEVLKR